MKNEYLNFLYRQTNIIRINDQVSRITTPFLDAQNDFVEIYIVQKDENSFMLTDDGITLNDLGMQGVHFEKSLKDMRYYNTFCMGYLLIYKKMSCVQKLMKKAWRKSCIS